jgi:hypothetical protein
MFCGICAFAGICGICEPPMFMVEVISQRPGFLAGCAPAMLAIAARQQAIAVITRILLIEPPLSSRCLWPRDSPLYRSKQSLEKRKFRHD